jgi:3-oxoacyl-[acyl-carrier protein] reductase
MNDILIRLANERYTAGLVRSLGLPAPVELRRGGTVDAQPLARAQVLLAGAHKAYALETARSTLRALGGSVHDELVDDESNFDVVVMDATGCDTPAAMRVLYEVFHPVVRRLRPCSRIVVLATSLGAQERPEGAAVSRGIEGFVRALGKEIGKRGATANLLYLTRESLRGLAGPLRFLSGNGAAYVSGQALEIEARVTPPPSLPTNARLAGKVALVTGAARGIGASVVDRLSAEGAKVIGVDLAPARDPLYEGMLRCGGIPLILDITDRDAAARLVEFVRTKLGGLDIVVHNAGITRDKSMANMKPEQWDQVMAVNLQAILAMDAALDEHQLLRDHARAVYLSSIGGIAGNYGQTHYAATKAALIGYVDARATQLCSRGITANAVAPGFIETSMVQTMPLMVREAGRRLNSLSQGGQPEDIAEAIAFLASPDAYSITGQTLRVCGQSLIGA